MSSREAKIFDVQKVVPQDGCPYLKISFDYDGLTFRVDVSYIRQDTGEWIPPVRAYVDLLIRSEVAKYEKERDEKRFMHSLLGAVVQL